jgi:hypothetical protein
MTETSHTTRRALIKSVPAACVATAAMPAAASAALGECLRPSLNDLIARHEQVIEACDDGFRAMHALQEQIRSERDTEWLMVPHTLMDDGKNIAGSYSEVLCYGNDFDKRSDRAHAEIRERLCPEWMQYAMPEQYASISAALDRSRARVGKIFSERAAEMERRKEERATPRHGKDTRRQRLRRSRLGSQSSSISRSTRPSRS